MPTQLPDVLTVERLLEAYDWLREDKLYDLLGSGELPGYKIGRQWLVDPADWTAFLERRRQAALGAETDADDAPPTPSRRRAS